MSTLAVGGIDNNGQLLKHVAKPVSSDDGVPRSYIRYDIAMQCVGVQQSASEVVGSLLIPAGLTDGITLPANLAGSSARALTAPTAQAVWSLTRIPAGSSAESTIATITFAANGTLGTFSTQAAVALAPGDAIRLKGPATVDSTMADVLFTIVGAR